MAETQEGFRNVTAGEFAALDYSQVTLVDLRDEAIRLVQGELPNSLKVPLANIGTGLSGIPKDKPVYVYCDHGDFSEEVADILADRGYDVYNVLGGFRAYREVAGADAPIVEAPVVTAPATSAPAQAAAVETTPTSAPVAQAVGVPAAQGQAAEAPSSSTTVAPADSEAGIYVGQAAEAAPASVAPAVEPIYIDAKGLKCPGPIVKVSDTLRDAPVGQVVRVEATEDAFASDIRIWCERTGNRLDAIEVEPGNIQATITKAQPVAPVAAAPAGNGKTFVVFSGDLDKTIAAFIMANGGAAMGREVTMFFTFWGLNILRRPEKVRVKKGFVGRAFGAMMPRGTRKLGLSRMNFGGAGAKMIRGVMKANGISSLEELIDQARAHGVRLVACQMSMEIMGITQEELIDGVELGGVATFLGSGEESDMSLFI